MILPILFLVFGIVAGIGWAVELKAKYGSDVGVGFGIAGIALATIALIVLVGLAAESVTIRAFADACAEKAEAYREAQAPCSLDWTQIPSAFMRHWRERMARIEEAEAIRLRAKLRAYNRFCFFCMNP